MAAAAEFLNSKGKCALVAGVKVRSCNAEAALLKFADATHYPVTGALLPPCGLQSRRCQRMRASRVRRIMSWHRQLCMRCANPS